MATLKTQRVEERMSLSLSFTNAILSVEMVCKSLIGRLGTDMVTSSLEEENGGSRPTYMRQNCCQQYVALCICALITAFTRPTTMLVCRLTTCS